MTCGNCSDDMNNDSAVADALKKVVEMKR
jgi:hypothetical protein